MKNLKIRKPRVYVAGPYSCQNRCEGIGVSLVAMREGIQACITLISDGMAPFCPWLDFMFVLMDHENGLPENWYYEYSNTFLLACDAMYIHNIRKESKGVADEMTLAGEHSIPIFSDYFELLEWRDKWTQEQIQAS